MAVEKNIVYPKMNQRGEDILPFEIKITNNFFVSKRRGYFAI
jgi:hypothetical protein